MNFAPLLLASLKSHFNGGHVAGPAEQRRNSATLRGGILMQSLKVLMMLCLFSLIATYELISPAPRMELAASGGQLKKESKAAYDVMVAYGKYYREELHKNTKASLELFDKQFQDLGNLIREARMQAREKFAKTVNEWGSQREIVDEKLREMKASWVAAWEATKKQIGARMEDLRKLFNPPSSANS